MDQIFTLNFSQVNKKDVEKVGGKGANLGEMTSFGMPVPPGFVVTASAYRQFLQDNKLKEKMSPLLNSLDVNNHNQLEEVSRKIKHLLSTSPVPKEIAREIISSYLKMSHDVEKNGRLGRILRAFSASGPLVAVRSSATSEDSKDASFAGQNETYLNIRGEASVVSAVRDCWSSLFEARSIFYRVQNHFNHFESAIAVVIQMMVQSEVSGIMFSIDPVTNNHDRIVIETVWGLGEFIVQGKVSPDHYEVNKNDLLIVEQKSVNQTIMMLRDHSGKNKTASVPREKQNRQKLTAEQIREAAKLSRELEQHYDWPQDSEFAVSDGRIYLVQTRPITTTVKRASSTPTSYQ